jgi:hypothetical protein
MPREVGKRRRPRWWRPAARGVAIDGDSLQLQRPLHKQLQLSLRGASSGNGNGNCRCARLDAISIAGEGEKHFIKLY